MIKGTLTRQMLGHKLTLGSLRIDFGDGRQWECFTCEDPVRGGGDPNTVKFWKAAGSTAIPYGTYKVKFTYSPKYKRNMWELQNVPGFSGIRIHSGNTEKDTEGCLLLGTYISPDFSGVRNSRDCVAEFEKLLHELGNPEWELEIRGDE